MTTHDAPRRSQSEDLARPLHAWLTSHWPWVVIWLLTRGLMLRHWAMDTQFIVNDVKYYFSQVAHAQGYLTVLREYPLPMVWLLDVLRWPAANQESLYVVLFALLMAALDALMTVALWRSGSRLASIGWMLFVWAMGPLVWFRYDLLPGVVVGLAVLLVSRRPAASGALVALGAGIKLWPALLLAALVGRSPAARLRHRSFWATGLGLALLTLLVAGPVRLVSPLTWQSDRGLQIESVWASLPMYRRAFGAQGATGQPDLRWTVQLSPFNAFEVTGPGVSQMLLAASVCMALGVTLALLMGVMVWHLDPPAHIRALVCLSIVSIMLVGNKTLSPQYMCWLGAVSAAWLALAPAGRQRLRAIAVGLVCLVLAWLTRQVYPDHYIGLISPNWVDPTVTRQLVVRNLGLVVLCVVTTGWALVELVRARFAPATHPTTTISPR